MIRFAYDNSSKLYVTFNFFWTEITAMTILNYIGKNNFRPPSQYVYLFSVSASII